MTQNKRFIDNGNNTITDLEMKLVWKKTDSFQDTKKWQNWFKCQDYAEIINLQRFAGSEDWRYPSEEEAWSLFDLSRFNLERFGEVEIEHARDNAVGECLAFGVVMHDCIVVRLTSIGNTILS